MSWLLFSLAVGMMPHWFAPGAASLGGMEQPCPLAAAVAHCDRSLCAKPAVAAAGCKSGSRSSASFSVAGAPCASASKSGCAKKCSSASPTVMAVPEAGTAQFVVWSGDGEGDAKGEKKVVRVFKSKDGKDGAVAADPNRGWLGVWIGEVPDALDAQLGLQGSGILVLNVAEGSPADLAGIQAHDVLVSIDGESVGGVAGLPELVSARKPGEKVSIKFMRHGNEISATTSLAQRPGDAEMSWKFESGPLAEVEEHVRTRGKILGKGPGGTWVMKDLGDVGDIEGLPKQLRMLLPKHGQRSTQVFVEGNSKTIKVNVDKDGASITLEQKDDGEITVTRSSDQGDSTNTYADADALEKGDPEAFELYSSAAGNVVIRMDDGEEGIHIDVDAIADLGEWHEEMSESLEEARAAYDEAMKEFHRAFQAMMQQSGQGTSKDGRSEPGFNVAVPRFHGGFGMIGKPKFSFETRVDGAIEVRSRKGDAESVLLFSGEADMARRNPELHAKYKELTEMEK